MKHLTKEQEKFVLQHLNPEDRMDTGSSRMVFHCCAEISEYLDLPCKCVVKLAVGHGGLNQHRVEVNTWTEFGNRNYLAEIFYAGNFVSIMEEVDPEDYWDLADEIDGDTDVADATENYLYYEMDIDANENPEEYNKEYKEMFKVIDTIAFCAYHNGCTSDNGQLGLTYDGRHVAYDYGFIADEGCRTQCSEDLVGNIHDDDAFEYYIDQLVMLIDEMIAVDEHLNYILAIENDINSGDWEESREPAVEPQTYVSTHGQLVVEG